MQFDSKSYNDHQVSKSYLAIVNGHVSFDKTVIDAPMIGIYEERPRQVMLSNTIYEHLYLY
jgi:23S rRNA-/tRNA-specific pseudouridylate synthase